MKARYSIWSLLRNALSYHENWPAAWRSPEPKQEYDAVIVGGGGHGLATAYYMAKEHGMTNIAVLERGWLGGGNTGRNTTIVRSNYMWDESAALYEHSLKLWETMSKELNFNVMFSQRGVLNLAHTQNELRVTKRRINSNRLNNIDSVWLGPEEVKKWVPAIDLLGNGRYPVLGGSLQFRGGVARHDAVAWGYARAADALGVDIIQQCPVEGFDIEDGQVTGVRTAKGTIKTKRVGVVVAGHAGVLADMAGFKLPINSRPLSALVSEPMKPCFHTTVMAGQVHAYCSQSDKGELVIGAGADPYNSYSQWGSNPVTEDTVAAICELYPIFRRVRMLRQWGGVVDIAPDASPIMGASPVRGMYLNVGWGTGGFKCTPGSGNVFADTMANDRPSPIAAPFRLDRFQTGGVIDEHAAAGVAH